MFKFFALFLLICCSALTPVLAADRKSETAFERVMKTKTLRCSYIIYPTFTEIDAKTGKMKGVMYDLTEELGRQLGFKIDWVEEIGTDQLFSGLGTRYDANCSGFFATPDRAKRGDFTKPLVYLPYAIYVRADETRFKEFEDLNADTVTGTSLDGELSQAIMRENFPKAKENSLPGLTPPIDKLLSVATKKADFSMIEPAVAEEYMAANPGKIKQLTDKPVRVGGSVIVIPQNEFALKNLLDTTIDTMLSTGATERIIAKNAKYKGSFLPPAKPY